MKINSFKKSYDGVTVLSFPGIEIEKGKIYAVIGPNGSGKSTFAKVISGIESSDEKANPVKNLKVGYMPQKSFAFNMSLFKNVMIDSKNEEKALILIEKLNLSALKKRNAKKLSGGETARMALARIMMNTYDITVLDEPTASMDMESTIISEKLILDYAKDNNTVILITHSISQAKRIADYVIFMLDGNMEQFGKTSDILDNTLNEKTRKFLEFYGV